MLNISLERSSLEPGNVGYPYIDLFHPCDTKSQNSINNYKLSWRCGNHDDKKRVGQFKSVTIFVLQTNCDNGIVDYLQYTLLAYLANL